MVVVMESNAHKKPPSLATLATGCCHCQHMKDLLKEESTSTEMPVKQPPAASMHPLLLAAACKGNLKELNHLLNSEETHAQPNMKPSQEFLDLFATYSSGRCANQSLTMQRAAADVEEGATMQAPSAAALLEGVTTEGDTVLHVVTAHGGGDDFVSCANLIHGRDKIFLYMQNNKGDTPLHCAAGAGKSQMVAHLIDLARVDLKVEDLLRKENNSKETALHEAVRIGDKGIVKELLRADPELACFPTNGTSPIYLAILLKEDNIASTLYADSRNNVLSYSGPNGQNALHAAVLRGTAITEKLLGWNKDLTTERDNKGSSPLHFAASLAIPGVGSFAVNLLVPRGLFGLILQASVLVPGGLSLPTARLYSQVFKANTAALYQPDNDGLSPIHVAASVGAVIAISRFVKECGSSAGLRDAKGRTFLHVAVEKRQAGTVYWACNYPSLTWIMNMQDNDGNTALHLAIQGASFTMFSALFGQPKVHIDLTNGKGQTPLDIAQYKVSPGLKFLLNSEVEILRALTLAGALSGSSRRDHFQESYEDTCRRLPEFEISELERVKDSTQSRSIAAVLIATVTFGASFALPGGYRADDHTNGGTPTLAGRYAFDAFVMANTLAFICSSIATTGFMYSGTSGINMRRRQSYLAISSGFLHTSITALTASVALGMYSVLAPVAGMTAIVICVISPLVVVYNNIEFLGKRILLVRAFYVRKGLLGTFAYITRTLGFLLAEQFPIIVTFCWVYLLSQQKFH